MQVREFDPRSLDKMLPCPFCGGDAELDTAQGYRAINGHFGNRVVVYCTKCDADMGTCVEDVPDIHPNEVIERWNKRHRANAGDAEERVERVARAIQEVMRRAESGDLPFPSAPEHPCAPLARAALVAMQERQP